MKFKCPRCGLDEFTNYLRPMVMPTLTLDIESKKWNVDNNAYFGVTAKYCGTCKYVEFEHITDEGLQTFLQDRIRSIIE